MLPERGPNLMSRRADTRWLTHASLEPRPQLPNWLQWPRSGWLALLLAVTAAGVTAAALGGSPGAADAREKQQALQAEVERLRTQLAVEHATRGELERQATGLNDQVAELTRQVQFLAARGGKDARQDQ
jgi:cell division protein FtsB